MPQAPSERQRFELLSADMGGIVLQLSGSTNAYMQVVLNVVGQSEMRATPIRDRFQSLAASWKRDTARLSVLQKKILHRAYQKIIGLGAPAVPLILEELRREPDHWFWALESITDENPAAGATTFDEARTAWLAWGREHGALAG